jgi:hypothetical protein
MISQHIGKGLTEDKRARWVALILRSAQDAGLPADPEFRSAFSSYIEWGSRLAVHPAFRSHGHLGATLIRLAVSRAHAQGCRTFLAHVPSQNEPSSCPAGRAGQLRHSPPSRPPVDAVRVRPLLVRRRQAQRAILDASATGRCRATARGPRRRCVRALGQERMLA